MCDPKMRSRHARYWGAADTVQGACVRACTGGDAAVLTISFSVGQILVHSPWRSALFLSGLGRKFWPHLAALAADDLASRPSCQVQCLICLCLRLARQLAKQRMQQQ